MYIIPIPIRDLFYHTGDWVTVTTTLRRNFVPITQPDAVMIAYQVIHQCDAAALLHSTTGRRELREFIAPWSEEDVDTPPTQLSCIATYTTSTYG
jgi:hypothetical protein